MHRKAAKEIKRQHAATKSAAYEAAEDQNKADQKSRTRGSDGCTPRSTCDGYISSGGATNEENIAAKMAASAASLEQGTQSTCMTKHPIGYTLSSIIGSI